ncbi:hypothetical protein CHS0354_040050 [Potamilus streckersoni]|uniref:Uncharacterized protein n=1 Tax=Potamilus streckersoni TaxID=2493646 RepID=A0AAE0W170_9BIVA|nr:hypothetical protein CHS0354_040050 [Potamilus streckersoni]
MSKPARIVDPLSKTTKTIQDLIEETKKAQTLHCMLCDGYFKDPKLLSCLHTFCKECLRRYVEKGKYNSNFPCPLCNRNIEIPKKGGVKGLPPNLYVLASEMTNKPPPCDVCNVGNPAVERCLDCESNMCDSCRIFHYKMKATRTHRTADIGTEKTTANKKIQEKIYCDSHPAEELRFFCVPCGKIVCRDCKTLHHTVHQTKEIGDVAVEKKREIVKSLKNVRSYLPKIEDHLKGLKVMLKAVTKNTQDTIKRIKAQAKVLHDEVDRICHEMVSEIKQKNKEMEQEIQKHQKERETVLASMTSIVLSAESFINVASDHDVIDNANNMRNRVENLPSEIPNASVDFTEFKFNPGPIPSVELFTCFGTWTSELSSTLAIAVPAQVRPALALVIREVNSFTVTGNKAIISIAPMKDGNAWICNSLSEKIFKYAKNGECLSTINVGYEVGDIHLASDGTVLISLPVQKKIRRLLTNGQVTDFATMPLFPSGLTQTDSGDVLVCAMDRLQETIKSPDSKGTVLRVTQYGRCERFEKDKLNYMFSRPVRVAINENKDICVSDWAKGHDHVVILTPDGKVKTRYYGPKEFSKLRENFVPNSLACDKYCQILIADSPNKTVHLLDKDGRFIKMLLNERDGIGEPWSLAVDSDGFLWVGDNNGTVRVYKYMS